MRSVTDPLSPLEAKTSARPPPAAPKGGAKGTPTPAPKGPTNPAPKGGKAQG